MDLHQGDVVRLTNFEHHNDNGRFRLRAPKKKVFVVMILGVEEKDPKDVGGLLDCQKAFFDIVEQVKKPMGEQDRPLIESELTSVVVKG